MQTATQSNLKKICGHQTILEEVSKLVLPTDKILAIEPTTENHYALNERFLVIRNEVEYFITVKEVCVSSTIIKSHVRIEVDTNLPNTEKEAKAKKQAELNDKKLEKIAELKVTLKEYKDLYIKAKNGDGKNLRYYGFQWKETKLKIEKIERTLK